MKMVQLSLALTVALLTQFVARAEDKPRASTADKPKVVSDADFLIRSISDGVAEVKLAEMADKRADSMAVKDFARQMQTDHTQANQKLMGFAKDLKIGVVAGTEREQREAVNRLSKLNGAEFDRAYMQLMVDEHNKAILLFENYSKGSAGNADLREMASKTLTKLREHRKEAQNILDGLKK